MGELVDTNGLYFASVASDCQYMQDKQLYLQYKYKLHVHSLADTYHLRLYNQYKY